MPVSVYTILRFSVELLSAEAVFVARLPRRRFFWLALFPLVAASLLVNALMAYYCRGYILSVCRYSAVLAISVLLAFACFRVRLRTALFCGIASYAVQFLSSRVSYFLEDLLGGVLPAAWIVVIYVANLILWRVLCWALFARRMDPEKLAVGRGDILTVTSLASAGMIFLNTLYTYTAEDSASVWIDLCVRGFGALVSLLVLCLMTDMFQKGEAERERRELEQIRFFENRQMAATKETIDYINIKCHDLKKMVGNYEGVLSAGDIGELKERIGIYDASVRTGSATLDLVIAQKAPECERGVLRLDVIADGAALSFLSDSDIYALFGNLIDNAAEAVAKLPEGADRTVTLSVKRRLGNVSVHVQNRYAGEISFFDGLPATSKGDRAQHGYGMRSIRSVIEKYGGTMSVRTEGGVFTVDALIPEPAEKEKEND